MKKKIIFFLSMIFIFMFNIEVQALTGTVYCPDDNQPLTIREAGSPTASGIGGAPCGAKIEILEQNATTSASSSGPMTWHKIKYDNKTGYVAAKYVTLDSSSYEKGKVICIENNDPLGIWNNPGRVGGKAASANCGDSINVIDKNAGTSGGCTWYKVEFNGTIGYSCGKYIDTSNNSSSGSGSSGVNVGKSTTGDNIYRKEDYDTRDSDGVGTCYENTGDVSLKSAAGSGSKTGTLSCGQKVKINETKEGSGACGYYYNVTTENNETGWTCAYYVNTTKLSSKAQSYYNSNGGVESYYTTLRNMGFPDSYLPYLAEIHARHPNWSFVPEKINLDFSEVVENQAYNGRSLLQKGNYGFDDNYISMDLNTYNILTNTFYDYSTETGWYNASKEAIAFYLDPRNYLNEKYIFGFTLLNYNSVYDQKLVNNIVGSIVDWNKVYNGSSNVANDIINSCKENDVSATYIASRMRQEIRGVGSSDPRLGGSWTSGGNTYSSYYNFFNISVYGENKIVRGMEYAKNNGWNTPYNAILGGGKFVKSQYIDINQDNVYYQKFDVSTTDGNYTHQYQQNLSAVVSEGGSAFISYATMGDYLSHDFTFVIPIYNNMPANAVDSPRLGNPNNYLSDLKVNGNTLSDFNYDKYEYDINVPAGIQTISVDATKIYSGASVSGTGTIEITSDNQVIDVVVIGQNTRTRTYKINVKRISANDEDIIDIVTIMNNSGVKYNNDYIFGIGANTGVSGFINNVTKSNMFASATIRDKNGNVKNDIFKTGDVVTVSNSKDTKKYSVVIYGDINGDGKIDKDDCLAILRQINGYANYEKAYKTAADANKDGKINKDDCLAILRQLNGYTNLNG